MPSLTQSGRLLAVTTPLGADALLLETISGSDFLSQPFQYELDMLTAPGRTVAFEQLIGQSITVKLAKADNGFTFFNGIVKRLKQGAQVADAGTRSAMTRIHAEIVPTFWLLTKRQQSRIFQQLNVPDILKTVLTGLDVKWEIQGTFQPRDYCTQYRESDFDFASRLMEEEGIYYYFVHGDGSHRMIVSNSPQSHLSVVPETIEFERMGGGNVGVDRIQGWEKSQELRTGRFTLWDHSFELPGQNLEATAKMTESVQVGTVSHKLKVAGDNLEQYDYPGRYAQRFDGIAPGGGDRASDIQKIFSDNKRSVALLMAEEATQGIRIHGESNCRQMSAGHKFTLSEHFDANGQYVLTSVHHTASQAGVFTSGGGDGEGTYSNTFDAIPIALPFVPARTTEKAVVQGAHTATVVGPPNEEIFVDKYSRVKVQFHWDRQGKKDANSSCWVRVATLWAGKQWGMIHIPRIGQEVIVSFEEGDPDQPIIVGSVYNAENMPPYTLPDNRTQSGVKSRSSLKASEEYFHELRFEDKKDSEQIYFHSQKDFHRVVENNDKLDIGFKHLDKGDREVNIHNNEKYTIGKPSESKNPSEGNQLVQIWNNQEIKIGEGKTDAKVGSRLVTIWNNDELTVGSGKSSTKVGSQIVSIWNNSEITIGSGKGQNPDGSQTVTIWKDRSTTLKTGNDKLTVSKGDHSVKISMGKSSTEAMQSIVFKVGQNSITIDQKGITLKGIMVAIDGSAKADLTGAMVSVNGSAICKVGGGITMIG